MKTTVQLDYGAATRQLCRGSSNVDTPLRSCLDAGTRRFAGIAPRRTHGMLAKVDRVDITPSPTAILLVPMVLRAEMTIAAAFDRSVCYPPVPSVQCPDHPAREYVAPWFER